MNIHTYGIGESALAEKIDSAMIPAGVSLAWLPQTGRVDLRLYGEDSQAVAKAVVTWSICKGIYLGLRRG